MKTAVEEIAKEPPTEFAKTYSIYFCLRAMDKQSCLASVTTNDYIEADSMNFSYYDLSRLGVSISLVFSSISTKVNVPCSDV